MKDYNGDFADFRYNRNVFNRKVSFQINRSSPFMINTNPSSFPPLLPDKRTSWKRVSLGKFSSKPIRLTVIKLDGSSFDVFVTKKVTVGKVKRAIEAAFSHLSIQGGETSERLTYGLEESEGSSSITDLHGDKQNKQTLVRNEVYKGYKCFDSNKSSFVGKMRWLFSQGTQEGPTKRNYRVFNSTIKLGQVLPCDDALMQIATKGEIFHAVHVHQTRSLTMLEVSVNQRAIA